MAKALEQELFNHIMRLDEAEKKSVLQMLKTFLRSREERSERLTIEQYNKELEEAEAEFERGEYVTHEQLLKEMKQW